MIKHLYDEIAKRWYRGGSIYFYSDPHFGDGDIYNMRFPYACDSTGDWNNCTHSPLTEQRIKELDEWQVKRINSKVGKNDTIVFLGDIGDVEYIKKIRGYKVLIMGNHDKGASNYNRKKLYDLREDNCTFKCIEDNHLFDEVYEGILMIGPKLILSHEPIEFPFAINIHGHDHSKKEGFDDNRHANVCAEHINYTPIGINDIVNSGKLGSVEDVHRVTIDKAVKRKSKKVNTLEKQGV